MIWSKGLWWNCITIWLVWITACQWWWNVFVGETDFFGWRSWLPFFSKLSSSHLSLLSWMFIFFQSDEDGMSSLTRWILSLEPSDSIRLVPVGEEYYFVWRSWDSLIWWNWAEIICSGVEILCSKDACCFYLYLYQLSIMMCNFSSDGIILVVGKFLHSKILYIDSCCKVD